MVLGRRWCEDSGGSGGGGGGRLGLAGGGSTGGTQNLGWSHSGNEWKEREQSGETSAAISGEANNPQKAQEICTYFPISVQPLQY